LKVFHHFSDGVYAKEMHLDAGEVIVSHKHKFHHFSILAQGSVIVEIDGGQERYCAPAVVTIQAGQHHRITALMRPVVWYCIHATHEKDEGKIDDALIDAPDMDAVVNLVIGER
jgi:quercetin dioxygenase-like cupin family protein